MIRTPLSYCTLPPQARQDALLPENFAATEAAAAGEKGRVWGRGTHQVGIWAGTNG